MLENAIEETLKGDEKIETVQFLNGMQQVHSIFYSLLKMILGETSEFYEKIIKASKIGFVQLDKMGCIVFANLEMRNMIGRDSVVGDSFDSFFRGEEKSFVNNFFKSKSNGVPRSEVRQLMFKSLDGRSFPAGVELASVFLRGNRKMSYARITDISKPIEMRDRIFDKAPLGITKVNRSGKILFANTNFQEICGSKNLKDKNIEILLPSEDDRKMLRHRLKERFQDGTADEYETEIVRLNDKMRIPVKVSAFPETDLSGKNIISSFAIVQSIVAKKMHRYIETIQQGELLLQKMAAETKRLVPFDLFAVSIYSTDIKHTRTIFSLYQDQKPNWQMRWWELTASGQKWVCQKDITLVPDIDDFFNQEEWKIYKKEADIQWLFSEGIRSFLFYPIFRDKKIVAAVSLMSKTESFYNDIHKKLLKDLPLDTAVLMALYHEENQNLKFQLELAKDIYSKGNDSQQISRVITEKIRKHYDWENVSLFIVDGEKGLISLTSQSSKSKETRFPETFQQTVDNGVLGYVYRNREGVRIGNVATNSKFKDIYVPTIASSKSELCLPIIAGKTFWLLNIEDTRQNAFSKNEEQALQQLVNEIGIYLERYWLSTFIETSLKSTSDAVIVTGSKGNIIEINPAALELLGCNLQQGGQADRSPMTLKDFFVDTDMADYILRSKKIPNVRVKMRKKDSNEVFEVLLSKFQLLDEFRLNVFIAKNLSLEQRVEELEFLRKMYFEIAIQIKTPLTLLFGWFKRLSKETLASTIMDTVDKSIRQLRKLELTYNRLALYDKRKTDEPDFPYNELLFNIKEIWSIVKKDFTESETQRIRIESEGSPRYLLGDIFQLTFCFESILSYLLRFLPDDEKILLRIIYREKDMTARISGFFPGFRDTSLTPLARCDIGQTLMDISLGQDIIDKFINNHGGDYHPPRYDGNKIEFIFDLPLAEGY